MRPANNQQLYNDDGTPRRKYEIDESPSNKYLLRASIGFVLANAFILAKNIMFGAEPASKQQQISLNAAANEPSEHAGEPNAAGLEEEETYGDGLASSQLDSGTISLLSNPGTASRFFGEQGAVRSTTSGTTFDKAHGNDNVALYGAAPGRPIGIFSGGAGSDSVPLPGQGGGGSGGASSGGSTGNGGGNPGDSSSGDGGGGGDDDDDETDPGPSTRVNRLPVIAAPLILPSLLTNQSVVIALSELLSNASDPDGDQLSVRNLSSSSGTLQTRSDGSWNFTPERDDTSDVTFTYNVSDGMGGVVQTTALLDLVPSHTTIVGTDGADIIVGTPYADIIDALCGDDIVLAREGDDVIFGGDGNDRIVAGDGNDVVYAGAGDDVVFGGGGNDIVFGGTGNDLLFGDDGNDVLLGEAGNDTIWGGAGADTISGGDGDDQLYGEDGDDFIDGGAGNNYLDGGAGNDTILVHAGDVANGGTGNDTFILMTHSSTPPTPVADPGPTQFGSGEVPADELDTLTTVATSSVEVPAEATAGTANTETSSSSQNVSDALAAAAVAPTGPQDNQSSTQVDGGDGIDTLDVQAVSVDMTVNLKDGAAFSTETGYIEIANVEDVTGGSGCNTIVGSDGANHLTGGASHDIILGEAGDDYIAGGDNDDLLAGGKDADTVLGGDGDDVIVATIDDGNDHYDGGSGSDTYDATMTSADLTVDLNAGVASSSETGEDTLTGIENVNCGSGDDTIVANDEVNTFTGGEGADTFVFGSVAAIGKGSGSRDKILDFAVGDRIDLDKISDDFVDDLQDAFGDHVIRRFVLIGAQETFSQAGQMKVRYEDTDDRQVTILEGNINGDADAEFELEFMGHIQFRYDDFIPRY